MWSRVSWRRQSATSESILSPVTVLVIGGASLFERGQRGVLLELLCPSCTGEREAGADSGTRSRARPR